MLGVAQVVEYLPKCLPSKCEALCLNSNTAKKRKCIINPLFLILPGLCEVPFAM
jgi:hypothetical protein